MKNLFNREKPCVSLSKAALFSLISSLFVTLNSARADSGAMTISARFTAPSVEISGLSIAGDSLFLASDRDFNLVSLPLFGDDIGSLRINDANGIDLKRPSTSSGSSQWEAIVVNLQSGTFLLNENENKIFHFDRDGALQKTYNLEAWSGRQNPKKGFEAMMLLKSNHFLLALESEPPTLIEYGPRGSIAQGFQASDGDALKTDDNFNAPDDNTLVPLATWSLQSGAGNCQFSDLARADDGGILLLMKVCMKLAHIKELKVDKTSFKADESWTVPAEVEHPEGLQALGDKGVLISRDLQTVETNLYWLKFPGK